MKPVAVAREGVPQSVIDKEIEIRTDIALNDPRNAGKPRELLEKIAQGSLNKFFQEVTLINQDFVKDGSKKVGEYVKSLDKDLAVTAFKHVTLG